MLSSINFGHVEFIYFLSDRLFLPGKHTFIFITMEKNKCEAESSEYRTTKIQCNHKKKSAKRRISQEADER